eukprot:g13507.t1
MDMELAKSNAGARNRMFRTCEEHYGIPKCWAQPKWTGGPIAYFIPQTGTFAPPNQFHLSSNLANALEVVDEMEYEPTRFNDTIGSDDPQWLSYTATCLGDAIKYTADMAQEAKKDQTRGAPPDRQEIGGPHTGDADDEGYVLDLDGFDDLDETFAEELQTLISIACTNDVKVTGVVAAAAGKPTSLTCDGEDCSSEESTLTWRIANLDESLREMTYVIDACDCNSAGGSMETLEIMNYTDSSGSMATHPILPTSIAVEVVDPFETCGIPSVALVSSGNLVSGNNNAYTTVGESVEFTFEVINTGSKTLHQFCVADSTLGEGCLDCALPTVSPGGSFLCDIIYEVTQRDLDYGAVQSSADVSAASVYADGEMVENSDSALVILKTLESVDVAYRGNWVDSNSNGLPDADEKVDFSIDVTNNGTVTLKNVTATSLTTVQTRCALGAVYVPTVT